MVRAEFQRALITGVQRLLGAIFVGVCVYAGGDLATQGVRYPALFLLELTQLVVVLIALRALRRPGNHNAAVPIAVSVVAVIYLTIASADLIIGGTPQTALLICALAVGTSAILPWGMRPQLLTVAIAGMALLANVYLFANGSLGEGYALGSTFAVGLALLGSVVAAGALQRYRERAMIEHLRVVGVENRLVKLDAELERRVSERTEELERVNRELESFSYAVSHDLKAPLRAVSGFAEALLEDYGELLPEEGRDQLHRLRAGTVRMRELIDGLLALAHAEHDEFESARVDLSGLARTIADDLAESQPERQVEVEIQKAMIVRGDRRLLQALMANLIGNAWKFTRTSAEAHIEVGLRKYGETPVYYVHDNGPGFDMGEASKLFEPFQRLTAARGVEGVGIGLMTAERVVRRHGGRIWAESRDRDGATFFFTLGAEAGPFAAGSDESAMDDDPDL